MRRLTACELIETVLDQASFESWDAPVPLSAVDESYRAELRRAAVKSGTDESVLSGRGLVNGRPLAVVANEFGFLGGSIGRQSARRIVSAIRRATAYRLPLLASTASGGTRMQEGTPAFVDMVEISRAVVAHRAAGLPYLVYLRHPTTGGVLASWGSLGHITVAEPGALVGFLGPKVYRALRGQSFPEGVQTAENLAAKGVIDAVVELADLASFVDRALAVLMDDAEEPRLPRRTQHGGTGRPAWTSVQLTRDPGRAGVRDLLRHAGRGTVRLHGTQDGERDDAILVALTRLDGQPCVLVGQDRLTQDHDHSLGPAGLREARRAMRLAEELRLPLMTVIDTPGAELSASAEERAVAGEIARCIATITTLSVPTVAVLLGQGCGGGALAFLPAQRVVAAENAWLSTLPLEGASQIMTGTTANAACLAERQKIRAIDLLREGVVHVVVPESDDDTCQGLAVAIAAEASRALHQLSRRTKPAPNALEGVSAGSPGTSVDCDAAALLGRENQGDVNQADAVYPRG